MNDKNLIPFNERTKSEQREIARKGGKASGISRGFKAAMKRKIKENPGLTDDIINVLLDVAFEDRNIKAIEMILQLNDENISDMDKKLKKAQLEKLKAETEEIRRRNDDGGGFAEEERQTLADALHESAAAVWEEESHEN